MIRDIDFGFTYSFPLRHIYFKKALEVFMKGNVQHRAEILGEYIRDEKTTVRDCAGHFGVSKSTVHKDVTQRLIRLNPSLYRDVREVLDINKEERHIRGGEATKRKYLSLKKGTS